MVMHLLLQANLASFMRAEASLFFCLWQARLISEPPVVILGETQVTSNFVKRK
jgi:hypothetical protein